MHTGPKVFLKSVLETYLAVRQWHDSWKRHKTLLSLVSCRILAAPLLTSGIDSGGAGSARAPPEFGGSLRFPKPQSCSYGIYCMLTHTICINICKFYKWNRSGESDWCRSTTRVPSRSIVSVPIGCGICWPLPRAGLMSWDRCTCCGKLGCWLTYS